MSRFLFALALLSTATAGDAPKPASGRPGGDVPVGEHRVVTPDQLAWKDGPAQIPGARMAVLEGDPNRSGLFTMRLRLPAGTKIPPHWHPADEHVTVVSGEVWMATGDTFDPEKGHAMTAGSFAFMPARTHHYAWARTESVVQLHGMGPWQMYFVEPTSVRPTQ
ncbi:MAG: cupin domain-containing protein [Myxococcota bacterium]